MTMLCAADGSGGSGPYSRKKNAQGQFRRSNSNRPTSAAQDMINAGRQQVSLGGRQRAADASARSNSLPPQMAAFGRPLRRPGRRGGSGRGRGGRPMQINGGLE